MCQQSKISGHNPRSSKQRAFCHPAFRLLGAALPAAMFLSGCSLRPDEKYVQPYSQEASDWRQYLGVAIAVQMLLLAWVFWSTGRKKKMSRMMLALLLVPLVWTVVGEWLYRLGNQLLGMGDAGKAGAVAISVAGGWLGSLNVYSYLVGGVVFNDPDFLLYWAVPGVAASYLFAGVFLLIGRRKGRGSGAPPRR